MCVLGSVCVYVCVCVCVCVCVYEEIYYKELVHMIMEAVKFQDLQGESASWRPKRANALVTI